MVLAQTSVIIPILNLLTDMIHRAFFEIGQIESTLSKNFLGHQEVLLLILVLHRGERQQSSPLDLNENVVQFLLRSSRRRNDQSNHLHHQEHLAVRIRHRRSIILSLTQGIHPTKCSGMRGFCLFVYNSGDAISQHGTEV